MNILPLITDSNNVSGLIFNSVIEFTGGDWIFVGLLIIALFVVIVLFSKMRSGAVLASGVAIVFVLSILYPGFFFLFWLAVIIAVFMLANAIRKRITGN